MAEKIKFSIIVPVYNREKYIRKCLKSILNQTYSNYEAIIVDDGSTDKSAKILDSYAEKHSNLIVIHQKNHGVSYARKNAIKQASGDYIAFVDADDWYETDFLETVYNCIEKSNPDIVQIGYKKFRFHLAKKVNSSAETYNFDYNSLKEFINGYGKISYRLWDKIYRIELVKNAADCVDTHFRIGQDAYLNLMILTKNEIGTISIIDKCLYNYLQGSGITSSDDIIMRYTETMKLKFGFYQYFVNELKDNNFIKLLFNDISIMTRYYACLFTEKYGNSDERQKIFSTVIFNNPTIIELVNYFKNNPSDIEECIILSQYSPEQYCEYIDNYFPKYKKELSFSQKLLNLLNK